jgi:hypothetical protein
MIKDKKINSIVKEIKQTPAERTHQLAVKEEELRRTGLEKKTVRLKAERELAEAARMKSI